MDFSNYLANKLISATVRTIAYTTKEKVYAALYTTDPTKEDVGDEVSAASYTRKEVGFVIPVDGVTTNAAKIEWGTATSDWGNVKYIGIRDDASGGNLLYFTALDNPKDILSGDQFIINVEQLKLTLT
jgi:hypothetical protein